MKVHYRSAFRFIMLLTFSSLAWCGDLEGLWQEYNDHTGKPEALILIEKLSDNTYAAKIEKLFLDTHDPSAMICSACPGKLKDHPLLGMRIMSGMKRIDKLNFDEGTILDPDEGKTYQCHIRLKEDGDTIEVTGYINFNWIGQSEIWRRLY